ncbi:beta-lactamase-like protein [Chaetomium sp. MPI-SDFR-AT-0129]|nr:beta-lactamase-like protein [Chaetomium sp. MPI-SDFR-AT-0129]
MATLPPIPEVTRLTPSCIRILAGNPGKFTLQGTNTYLLGTGPRRLLIDTGEGRSSWATALRRVLSEERAKVAHALITHRHGDHIGGVGDLRTFVFKDQSEGDEGSWTHARIVDGQQFRVEGATLTAVHTPGHTPDHVVFFWDEEGALFTGDNVLGHGTSVFGDLGQYVSSLEKMGQLYEEKTDTKGGTGAGTKKAYPAHGEVVEDGPGRIAEYIRHRGQREEQVVQALRSVGAVSTTGTNNGSENGNGVAWTVMELVKSIYRDVPESLHLAAANGVVQILHKLEREGRAVAVDDGERWRLVNGAGRSAL